MTTYFWFADRSWWYGDDAGSRIGPFESCAKATAAAHRAHPVRPDGDWMKAVPPGRRGRRNAKVLPKSTQLLAVQDDPKHPDVPSGSQTTPKRVSNAGQLTLVPPSAPPDFAGKNRKNPARIPLPRVDRVGPRRIAIPRQASLGALVTATVCGDPAPGRSALDQQRGRQ